MWDELAIAPTDDPKAIRRAYAARLKQLDPDREREAFARLRQALEWALASARQPRLPAPARDAVLVDKPGPSAALDVAQALQPRYDVRIVPAALPDALRKPPSEVSRESGDERALLVGLEAALQRRDARAAWRLYFRAAATGAVPLGESERMLARLFAVSLEPTALDSATFRDMARDFGWDQPQFGSAVEFHVHQQVAARLAAEDWYDDLVAIADSKRWLFGRRKSRIARLMLRRIRGWGLLRIDRPALRVTLGSLMPHQVWLRGRISPEWVAALERRMRRRELFANGAGIFILSFVLAEAVISLIAGASGWNKDDSVRAIVSLSAIAALLIVLLRAGAKHFIGMWRSRR